MILSFFFGTKTLIAQNDIDTKVRQLREFLTAGKRVRLAVHHKKRQNRQFLHMDQWRQVLQTVLEAVQDVGKVDKNFNMEGSQMVVYVSPVLPGAKDD